MRGFSSNRHHQGQHSCLQSCSQSRILRPARILARGVNSAAKGVKITKVQRCHAHERNLHLERIFIFAPREIHALQRSIFAACGRGFTRSSFGGSSNRRRHAGKILLCWVSCCSQITGYWLLTLAGGAGHCHGQSAPDLILLDVMMPEMDGYQVLAELRQNPAYGADSGDLRHGDGRAGR